MSPEHPAPRFPEAELVEVEPSARLRLLSCRLDRRPGTMSRVVVEFSGPHPGERIVCEREATTCNAGDLRLASMATLDAMSRATRGALQVELIGVKPIRAFDSNIVVVAAMARHDGMSTRITGAAIADDDLALATVRATLSAVNRLASPLLARLLVPE